ncbi:hypothetical protein [Halobellus sp. EA9]|uniref:hypothetical protein n=1 Tax=Halobellus sp. EA9 TaxID=3421647 RepID=UPI003EBA96AF
MVRVETVECEPIPEGVSVAVDGDCVVGAADVVAVAGREITDDLELLPVEPLIVADSIRL